MPKEYVSQVEKTGCSFVTRAVVRKTYVTHNSKNQEEMKISNMITGLSACENGQPMKYINGQGDCEEVGNSTPEVSDGEVVQRNDGNSGKPVPSLSQERQKLKLITVVRESHSSGLLQRLHLCAASLQLLLGLSIRVALKSE